MALQDDAEVSPDQTVSPDQAVSLDQSARAVPAGWVLWGRADINAPREQTALGTVVNGQVVSGHVGIERRFNRWLAGVAVSRAEGEFDTNERSGVAGEWASSLTSVTPYGHWAPSKRLSMWGLAGLGWGDMIVTDPGGVEQDTDLAMRLAAVGGRQVLGELGMVQTQLKADAFMIAMESAAAERLLARSVEVSRVRVGLEGGRVWPLGGGSLQTRGELGVRVDRGDAATGAGLETGGGVTWTNLELGLSVEARGRYLVVHEARGVRDWGASLNVRLAPGEYGEGLSLSVPPVWGQAESNVRALWQPGRLGQGGLAGPTGVGASGLGWGGREMLLDVALGYGVRLDLPFLGQGLVTPFSHLSVSGGAVQRLRVGSQLGLWEVAEGATVDLYGERAGGRWGQAPTNAIMLQIQYVL